ncbi:2-keto-4-pentenoate hydratase/2-oxohepta-3-ene-1,7-dioic acid hydratase (catechol pathway) [Nonlabens sp. Hel1_33_55]|uniref:fumarylacetoacetate hydrolase family protein n=1 Tax=Nonlabens sp. Hel1_33_55 TaxID=1336802 RepID=UPI000875C30F|nr:fumarylacetoacetate hydrolase family protein [Nonlabens sp. Hel1_33_55]SCX91636.1 2-keto-4-pentenoate hydratase/2-oxohepta-3-ene-1,7-dioic acid hydratase (catechol pathway) [Nonlabens sp. Hel1_33_55]
MKIICIGRNYVEHIRELDSERPDEPIVFLKPDTSILLDKNPFFIPDFSDDVHHEIEVVIKINRLGKHIDEKFAHKYYNEIGLGIDFTARDLQNELKAKGLPWEKCKAFDGATVVSRTFIDKKELGDLGQLGFQLYKNDVLQQDGNTNLMLWKVDELIAYVSKFFTLKIGDLIFTGTPAGVSRVQENDSLKGFLAGKELFSIRVK